MAVLDRDRVGPGVAAGVTEAMIHDVVHGFYDKVRRDPALGPIFSREIPQAAWPAHLAKMCDFWSSVLLMTGRFKGAPMATHARLPELRPTHFARWLHLFRHTADRLCPPEAAALFVSRSEMIAESLQLGIAARSGALSIGPPSDDESRRPTRSAGS
ncbi:MAG: preprotein translocase subunit TatC [Phenylobacterium sp.]|nr:preprotein translocase subunit TatC [Phenylobacterium sp.]